MRTNERGETECPERTVVAAAEWRLIGLLLERPRPAWREEIRKLALENDSTSLRDVALLARNASEGEYLRLLGPGGLVSPRSVAYRPFEDPGWLLADIAHFYGAFGFQPHAEDPIDHIAVEAGFVGYMYLKEAFALASGDAVAAKTTAEARERFMSDHLGTIADPFLQRLELAGSSYLLYTARLLRERVPAPRVGEANPKHCVVPSACSACMG